MFGTTGLVTWTSVCSLGHQSRVYTMALDGILLGRLDSMEHRARSLIDPGVELYINMG